MKHVWIGILAGLLATQQMNAQVDGVNSRRWEQGKLTWDDFTKLENGTKNPASLFYYITYDAAHQKIHDTMVNHLVVDTYCDRDSSTVDLRFANSRELHYQQVIFNMVELQSRNLQQTVNRLRRQSEIDSCLRNGINRLNREVEIFKTASRQGADSMVVKRWADSVQRQLDRTPDRLESVPAFQPALFGFGAGVGIGSRLYTGKLQEYFRPKADVHFSLEFALGRTELMLNAGLGGTAVKMDSLPIPGERWSSSNHLELCQLSAALGYRIWDQKKIQIMPFVGYGSSEISTIPGQNDEVKHRKKTGGVLGGLCMDYRLRTSLNIAPNYLPTKECHNLSLRAKIYVTQANFTDYMQGMTINFALSVNIFDRFVNLK